MTTSFGGAFVPDETTELSEALRVADQRLCAQKHSTSGEVISPVASPVTDARGRRHADLGAVEGERAIEGSPG